MRSILATRPRQAAAVIGVFLVAAGAAYAAWTIYSGVTGQVAGRTGTPVTIGALTLAPNQAVLQASDEFGGSSAGAAGFLVTNADTSLGHTITSASVNGPLGGNATCTPYITVTPSVLVGVSVPAGATNMPLAVPGFWHAAPDMPSTCQAEQFSVSITGTTS